jgi:flagellar protein FliS
MSAAALRARYLGDTIATASPQQLLVMLYDRLALDLERAQAALFAGDRTTANDQLLHAQDIVLELRSSLKVDVWEGGPRLAALYDWLLTELMQANVKRDANRVSSCRQIVEPLRDAWRQAAATLATSPS